MDPVPSSWSGSMLGEAPVRTVSNGTAGIGWITPDLTRPMRQKSEGWALDRGGISVAVEGVFAAACNSD